MVFLRLGLHPTSALTYSHTPIRPLLKFLFSQFDSPLDNRGRSTRASKTKKKTRKRKRMLLTGRALFLSSEVDVKSPGHDLAGIFFGFWNLSE